MRLALDTNAYTNLARGDPQLAALVSNAAEVQVPFIVLAELRAGFAVGTKTAANERQLALFLGKPNVKVVFADEATIQHYVEVYRQLRGLGRMIPTNDLWIAALSVQHGAVLATGDAHFDVVPGLVRA
jgi:tRNA(fMet)-specific endonuclease VapC